MSLIESNGMRTIIAALLFLMLYSPSLVWAEGFGYDTEGTLPIVLEDVIWASRSTRRSLVTSTAIAVSMLQT